MKFATALSAWILAAVGSTEGFSGSIPLFSRHPAVAGAILRSADPTSIATCTGYRASWRAYENSRDPSSSSSSDANVWTILSHTEEWISQTLASNDTGNGNPYSRKEVNYVCETQADAPMIVANLFKRLREAREIGERHGMDEEDRMTDQGNNYRPHTLRQTQVMVMPGNEGLCDSFPVFDNFIKAVNNARRNARDLLTDTQLEKLDESMAGEATQDWSVSVNCAHLHPDFGKKTSQDILKEMKQEEKTGEVDLHAQEYAKKRMLARQSPYPTVVLEVRAQPAPNFGAQQHPPTKPTAAAEVPVDKDGDDDGDYNRMDLLQKDVTSADIQKLEALFGKAAVTEKNVSEEGTSSTDGDFYDAIAKTIEEVSSISHMQRAQEWILENDKKCSTTTSAFTESDTTEIDHGYEFVFTNMAMQKQQASVDKIPGTRRQYLVMPHFLSSSATSLEKFTTEVKNIVDTLPELRDHVNVSIFHPEHVEEKRRSSMPIICLHWTEGDDAL